MPLRILAIINSADKRVTAAIGSKSITVGESRGVIYDRNLERLVCDTAYTVCAVKPSAEALFKLKPCLSEEAYKNVYEEISKGNPVVTKINSSADVDMTTAIIYNRYNPQNLATHLIGYTNINGGVCGIEKSFERVLSDYSGELAVRFAVDATGKVLMGKDASVVDNGYNSKGGVVLTIDKEYQQALEQAMDEYKIEKGSAVMIEIKSGAVVAMASRPNYSQNSVADCIADEASSLFNRALGAYPAGSVFKLLIALSALEQGIDPAEAYACTGSVGSFTCPSAHGEVDMPRAVAYSCNCFFINLVKRLDIEKTLELAENLGFGSSVELADYLKSYSGYLPKIDELHSFGEKANFSFGQGKLSVTPLQIASLYCAIAAGGAYCKPSILKGFCDKDGGFTASNSSVSPCRVASEKSASLLNDFLELAVREGTGKKATVDGITVCGKTGTAESGEFVNGKERFVTWFAGYYPYESPKYTLVIVCDDGISGSSDCAPVFARTVSLITK